MGIFDLTRYEWQIAWRRTEKDDRGLPKPSAPFFPVPNSPSLYAADPFLFEYEGETYLFAEIYSLWTTRGMIGFSKWEDGRFTPWQIVIQEPFHISFPNLFRYRGRIFLCPESIAGESVYFYEALEFPRVWKKHKPFIQGLECTDTVFLERNGVLYGFTCIYTVNRDQQLFLFRFTDFENGIISWHPDNPIAADDGMLRAGGKIIVTPDSEYRVAQDCRSSYGKGLFFRKTRFDWPDYEETNVMQWYPENLAIKTKRKVLGVHTYNSTEQFEVIDFRYKKFSMTRVLRRLYNLFGGTTVK